MSTFKYSYFDRNGLPLIPGQVVVVQHCVGSYGQVRNTKGTLKSIGRCHEVYLDTGREGEGNCLYPGFSIDDTLGAHCLRGYERHTDFEHGHEKWIEVITE